MSITVILLLFKLEEKKIALSQWSTLRRFNWEHSNSYTIRKLTDLFCLTILFAKFNMLAGFILRFLQILRDALPHDFQIDKGHKV